MDHSPKSPERSDAKLQALLTFYKHLSATESNLYAFLVSQTTESISITLVNRGADWLAIGKAYNGTEAKVVLFASGDDGVDALVRLGRLMADPSKWRLDTPKDSK